ncbi:hypothetical protein P5673_000568 [Acropora cervicornis]|uniref:TMEM248/TMEM219 domain-containing protein n=1 Tax=Acropora cervicornis TaxID=6130 RepID=A0AAD9R7C4_ACRCE|nr:hypothetical protein P5673_000568 [Acropora cervicornis]
MADCRCCKNLLGFAASRPPCFVFTVCLTAFAIGLFSLGYFVQLYDWIDDSGEEISSKGWNSLLINLGSSEFCILGNQSFLQNSTHANSTNVTYHLAPAGYTTVNIPQLDLFITPSDGFSEMVANTAREESANLYMSRHVDLLGNPSSCNVSSDVNIVEMVNNEKYRTTVFPVDKQCIDGIRAETYLPLKDKGTPTGTISMMDALAVNLRLQYSSYFLFVLVITCVLYGMIKGRPGKQGFIKKIIQYFALLKEKLPEKFQLLASQCCLCDAWAKLLSSNLWSNLHFVTV